MISVIWESKMNLIMWVQGKLVGRLAVPELTVIISTGKSLETADLFAFSDFLWQSPCAGLPCSFSSTPAPQHMLNC